MKASLEWVLWREAQCRLSTGRRALAGRGWCVSTVSKSGALSGCRVHPGQGSAGLQALCTQRGTLAAVRWRGGRDGTWSPNAVKWP